jgi:hypothetical protein
MRVMGILLIVVIVEAFLTSILHKRDIRSKSNTFAVVIIMLGVTVTLTFVTLAVAMCAELIDIIHLFI